MINKLTLTVACALSITATAPLVFAQAAHPTVVTKLGIDQDVRSGVKILVDDIIAGNVILPDSSSPVTVLPVVPQIQLRGSNVQTNDPAGDYVQTFTGFRPFVHATQSEVSTAAFGRNIVTGYNNSAGGHLIPNPSGPGLVVDRIQGFRLLRVKRWRQDVAERLFTGLARYNGHVWRSFPWRRPERRLLLRYSGGGFLRNRHGSG